MPWSQSFEILCYSENNGIFGSNLGVHVLEFPISRCCCFAFVDLFLFYSSYFSYRCFPVICLLNYLLIYLVIHILSFASKFNFKYNLGTSCYKWILELSNLLLHYQKKKPTKRNKQISYLWQIIERKCDWIRSS